MNPSKSKPQASELSPDQRRKDALAGLSEVAEHLRSDFEVSKTVLSFREYVELFIEDPARHGRDAATYVRDMFDHFGTSEIEKPTGRVTRFALFDAPWAREGGTVESREPTLVAQEELQGAIYKFLSNFVNEGRANKLVLAHGPNGSAKSTTAACILRGLEHYSMLPEGALYRFHWVFPSRKSTRGAIGFGGERSNEVSDESWEETFAHLTDDDIDARLVMELRDHPLFLLPVKHRQPLLEKWFAGRGLTPPTWLKTGLLSHKNQQVFQALLMSEAGSLPRVLRHVQVERWFISRKYRQGAITLGPELSVDAGERQITADRSLSALPTALQATTLFEAHGELVEAAGGVLEFSDLLKRPIDAFRYLQLTLETGEIALPHQNVQTNVVMIGSANEIHLSAFREHPEFPSFRGRFELVPAPYLRNSLDEQQIYDRQIVPYLGCHVAPHATRVAAEFAVMTRLEKPAQDKYPNELGKILKELTVEQKMDLYARGRVPESFESDARKLLRAGIGDIYRETDASTDYEGKEGASPRTMRTVLLNASQNRHYGYLSPFAVLDELDELCKQMSEYDWLRNKTQLGHYHDAAEMRTIARRRLLETLEEEMRKASGLVDEDKYRELFDRYVHHVSVWVKGETIRNQHTGEHEKADERMMREVEALLGVTSKNDDHRKSFISSIAAWAIDHPGERHSNDVVFPDLQKNLRDAVFTERRKPVALLVRDLVRVLREKKERVGAEPNERELRDLGESRRKEAWAMMERLRAIGYSELSALDAASAVLRSRFAELVV